MTYKKKRHTKIDLSDYSPKTQESIDKVIREMCDEHQSEDLEQDIVALFEDIIQFFSGRSEDFVDIESLSAGQKKELYAQIRAVIEILKKLKGGKEREDIIKILSKGMLSSFSKNGNKKPVLDNLNLEEQKRLKETFARMTIQQMHDKQAQYRKELNDQQLIEKIKVNAGKFAEKIKEQNLEKKSKSLGRSL